MNSIIAEKIYENQEQNNTILKFFKKFSIGEAMLQLSYYKAKGAKPAELLKYLIGIVFRHTNYQPYYTDEYYADEDFNDSPEYFKWLFGVLLDMAILGTIPMREFARRELIFLLFYGDELRETDIRDFQYEFVSTDTKEEEQPSEEQAKEEFRKIVDKAIKRRKQYDTNFTVEKLCFDTLHINNASFSRMKKGSVGISREMLLRIAVGIKMTQWEMRRAFFLKGMKFPVFKHEKVIDACIREGKGSMTELLALIPEEKRFGRAEKEK